MEFNDILAMMKITANATVTGNKAVNYKWNDKVLEFSAIEATLKNELKALGGTWESYQENKRKIFALMEQTITEVLPKKVEKRYEQFAEVKTYQNGDAPVWKRKLDTRARAKQFATRAALEGVYEVFKLAWNQETFEVRTSAIGGAVQIGMEEFLAGRQDMGELLEILMIALDELIYKEVAASLKASVNQLPVANRVAVNGFDEAAMDQLINIASAYGEPVIYCTYEFAVRMVPKDAWRYTEAMKDELWKTGRLADYKGHKVVILEQGFEDATNSTKVIDPGYAWVIPSGANGKPVKIAFEGNTMIDERKNADWSRDIHVYKKVGVVTMLTNDICCYADTSLLGKMNTWKLDGIAGSVYNYAGQLSH